MSVEMGTVHTGKLVVPSTSIRHAPHIPVPSIMMGFMLTMVFNSKGLVTWDIRYIIKVHPTAMTTVIFYP